VLITVGVGIAFAVAASAQTQASEYAHRGRFFLPENVSTIGETIDRLFWFIFAITGIVFIGVEAVLVVFLIKYRRREGGRGVSVHGNNKLEIVWTAIPAAFLVVLALMSQRAWSKAKPGLAEFTGAVSQQDAVIIEIVAQQFAWNIRYAGKDGLFGRRDPALVDASNPIGLDLNDPTAKDDILTVNQLHFPVNRKIRVRLTSLDVLHSFFLPEFRVKQDAVPGMLVNVIFDGKKPGDYEIACAELCGLGHYRMKGFVTVHDSDASFQRWLDEQAAQLIPEQTPNETATPEPSTTETTNDDGASQAEPTGSSATLQAQ
jgi:cytochrome c oxidase subunit 2